MGGTREASQVRLLDVNVLLAIFDGAHIHHQKAVEWFDTHHSDGWATCSLTQNGFIRIVSGFAYPNLRVSPAEASDALRELTKNYAKSHQFWPQTLSIMERERFDLTRLNSSKQITDAYLAGLAFQKGAKFATLDNRIAWKAVAGATEQLIELI